MEEDEVDEFDQSLRLKMSIMNSYVIIAVVYFIYELLVNGVIVSFIATDVESAFQVEIFKEGF